MESLFDSLFVIRLPTFLLGLLLVNRPLCSVKFGTNVAIVTEAGQGLFILYVSV